MNVTATKPVPARVLLTGTLETANGLRIDLNYVVLSITQASELRDQLQRAITEIVHGS